jgi:hypothetical protein
MEKRAVMDEPPASLAMYVGPEPDAGCNCRSKDRTTERGQVFSEVLAIVRGPDAPGSHGGAM